MPVVAARVDSVPMTPRVVLGSIEDMVPECSMCAQHELFILILQMILQQNPRHALLSYFRRVAPKYKATPAYGFRHGQSCAICRTKSRTNLCEFEKRQKPWVARAGCAGGRDLESRLTHLSLSVRFQSSPCVRFQLSTKLLHTARWLKKTKINRSKGESCRLDFDNSW